MPTESIQIDPVGRPHPPPKVAEPLTCPRCDSNNTKFCYYNNYNLSQPRHFCKACRRYWTHGGTLRNVPIGGGIRKSSKRSRSYSSSTTTSTTTNSSSSTAANTTTTTSASHGYQTDQSLPVPAIPEVSTLKSENLSDFLNINNESISLFGQDGNFDSFLSSEHGQGFMGMVGHTSGFGYGFCETGRANWAYPAGMRYVKGEAVDGGYAIEGDNSSGCNTWQQVEVGDELVDGDHGCFSWPGLAISTPGKVFK